KTLSAGDGAAVGDEKTLEISALDEAEILLFDLV
ncbi:MAG: pirin family protein, partial [Candidatus Binatia bacterium]